jgi:hypothetical protein
MVVAIQPAVYGWHGSGTATGTPDISAALRALNRFEMQIVAEAIKKRASKTPSPDVG